MGSSCVTLTQHKSRYKRARTRSDNRPIDHCPFPSSIDVHKKYIFAEELEEGATGRVVKGTERNNPNKTVAIKIIPKSSDHGNETATSLYRNEIDILRRINHKNIVQLIDISEDNDNYYVILELGAGGDLVEHIFNDNINITEEKAALWTRTMLHTLQYMHSINIVHCDLKPENIVFKTSKGCDDILFIDFGLAKIVDDNTVYCDLCANKYYTAPEIAKHYLNSEKDKPDTITELTGHIWKCCDVWAVGVIAYIMVLKTLPFFSRSDRGTFERIVNDTLILPGLDDNEYAISSEFRDFISKMLHKNPYKRLTVDQALRHPWILTPLDMELNAEVLSVLTQSNSSQSNLKKLIIDKMKYSHFGTDEMIAMHFERLDKNNYGVLDVNEIENLLLDIGYNECIVNRQAMEILGNGSVIDFEEFKHLWHRKLLSNDEKYIETLFDTTDYQKQFDANEIQSRFGGHLSEIKLMITEWDIDNTHKLSLEQIKKAMQEYPSNFLISGYIRHFIFEVTKDINIVETDRITNIVKKTHMKTRLIVVDDNLYYNYSLISHMTFNQNIHSVMTNNERTNNVPPLIIRTISDILFNFDMNGLIDIVGDSSINGRTNNIQC